MNRSVRGVLWIASLTASHKVVTSRPEGLHGEAPMLLTAVLASKGWGSASRFWPVDSAEWRRISGVAAELGARGGANAAGMVLVTTANAAGMVLVTTANAAGWARDPVAQPPPGAREKFPASDPTYRRPEHL